MRSTGILGSALVAVLLISCGSSERSDDEPTAGAGAGGVGGSASGGKGGQVAGGSSGSGAGTSGSGGALAAGAGGEAAGGTGESGASDGGASGGSAGTPYPGCATQCDVGTTVCDAGYLGVCSLGADGCPIYVRENCAECASDDSCNSEFDHLWASDGSGAWGVAFDPDGNLYTVGDLMNGPVPIAESHGGGDAGLVKWSPETVLWTTWMGTEIWDTGKSVGTDADGNVYSLTLNLEEGSSDSNLAVFQHHPDGSEGFRTNFSTPQSEESGVLVSDAAGHVYVSGATTGELDGETALGDYDAFLARLVPGGSKDWTRQFGTTAKDLARGIAIDGAGNAFVTGLTFGVFDGETSAGNEDAFLVAVSAAGEISWVRQWGTAEFDSADSVAVTNDGIYVAGMSDGPIDPESPSPGGSETYVARFDTDGALQWLRHIGGNQDEQQPRIAANAEGRIFVVISSESMFPESPPRDSLASDLYLAEVSPDGSYQILIGFGSESYDLPFAMAFDPISPRLVISGYTQSDGAFLKFVDLE